jgi:hypothetical protein
VITRNASCSCGALTLTCTGEPVRVSVCHCLACQRRTGSTFGAQARFAREQVGAIAPSARSYMRTADTGNLVTFRFCGDCGATVCWELAALPGFIAVPLGAFGDPSFGVPVVSIYEARRYPWAQIATDGELEHMD